MTFKEGSAQLRPERKRVGAGGSCRQWESADTRRQPPRALPRELKKTRVPTVSLRVFWVVEAGVARAQVGRKGLKGQGVSVFSVATVPFGLHPRFPLSDKLFS